MDALSIGIVLFGVVFIIGGLVLSHRANKVVEKIEEEMRNKKNK